MYDNNQSTFNPYAQNITILKNYFKRPAVLTLGILYIISGIVTLAVSVLSNSYLKDILNYTANLDSLSSVKPIPALDAINDFLPNAVMFSAVPSLIISALFATAFIIIYAKSKNPSLNATPKSGFSILFVLAVLNLISAIFATLILLLFVAFFIALLASLSKDAQMANSDIIAMSILTIFVVAIFIFIGVVLLVYAISNLKYIKAVKTGLTSVALSEKGAGVYGVFSIIYGILTLISSIQSLLAIPMMSMLNDLSLTSPVMQSQSFNIMTLVTCGASALSAVIMIFNAIIALGYKKYIHNITGEFNDMSSIQNDALPQE